MVFYPFPINNTFAREPPGSIPFTPHETYFVPARIRLLIKARVGNNRKSGYVPRIQAGPGLYAGGCLVANRDGRAPMFIINITTEDVNITIPPIMLKNYDRTIAPIRTIQANSEEERKDQNKTQNKQNNTMFGFRWIEHRRKK